MTEEQLNELIEKRKKDVATKNGEEYVPQHEEIVDKTSPEYLSSKIAKLEELSFWMITVDSTDNMFCSGPDKTARTTRHSAVGAASSTSDDKIRKAKSGIILILLPNV